MHFTYDSLDKEDGELGFQKDSSQDSSVSVLHKCVIKQVIKTYNIVKEEKNVVLHNHTSCNGSFNTKKSAKNSLRAPSIKRKVCKYISVSGGNVFLRRQGDHSKPLESLMDKSQHFSWKIYSTAEQPFVLTPHGCL